MILHCYVEGSRNHWEGLILDFDLAVSATSRADVERKLYEAVQAYVETLNELPEEERDAFLRRRAPASVWIGCYLRSLWSTIRRRLGRGPDGHKERAEFTIACPA